VSAATKNDAAFESSQVGLGNSQTVVEARHFLIEKHFGLVAFFGKGVKSIGKTVVENRQLRDDFGWNNA